MGTIVWLIIYFAVLIWSVINPHDYFTWLLEALPGVVGFVILAATWKRFPLTRLTYMLILIHCIILFVGAHYTYAEVDLFKPVREFFGWQRNNYDKIGHFAQGFVPSIITREILIRKKVVNGRGWLNLFVISICLASARCMNSSSGGWPSSLAIRRRVFSELRVTRGIHSRTWPLPLWELFYPWQYSVNCTTSN